MLATLVRIGLLIGIMYAYLITLGVVLHSTKPGWVTQDVQLGPVYDNRSEDSPLALWSSDLEFIDVNGRYQSVHRRGRGRRADRQLVRGHRHPAAAPVDHHDVDLPPARRRPRPRPPVAPPATDSTGKLTDTKKVCVNSIEIAYDPANPKVIEVVGAKDTEVLAFGVLTLWAVFLVSILVLLKALFGSYHPEGKGSMVKVVRGASSGSPAWCPARSSSRSSRSWPRCCCGRRCGAS